MAFDEQLADRIRLAFQSRKVGFDEKRMFGGLCFMVDDKMCVGVHKHDLMVRIDPSDEESALAKTGARKMDFTGRPMRGFLFVGPEGIDLDEQIDTWIELALKYNPLAKSSKKKKKKLPNRKS